MRSLKNADGLRFRHQTIRRLLIDKVTNLELQRELIFRLLDIGRVSDVSQVLSSGVVTDVELQRELVCRLLDMGHLSDIVKVISSGAVIDVELQRELVHRLLDIGRVSDVSQVLSSGVVRDEDLQKALVFRFLDIEVGSYLVDVLLSGGVRNEELQRLMVNRFMEEGEEMYAVHIFASGGVTDLKSLYSLVKKFVTIEREYSDNFFFDIKLQRQIAELIIAEDVINSYRMCINVVNHQIFNDGIKAELLDTVADYQKVELLNKAVDVYRMPQQNIVSTINGIRMRGERIGSDEQAIIYYSLGRSYAANVLSRNIDIASSEGVISLLCNIGNIQDRSRLKLNDEALKQVLLTLGKVGSDVVGMIFDAEGRYSQEKLDVCLDELKNQWSWSESVSGEEMKTGRSAG